MYSLLLKKTIKALGLVFGDIGTSPIYTLTVVFLFIPPTKENVLGVLSLILWTLIVLPTIQYSVLAMSISLRGEGGILVLSEVLKKFIKEKRAKSLITFISFVGISFLIGDGVITPSISILSAVEGISLISYFAQISKEEIIIISIIIAIFLFAYQSRGSEKVSASFGPIMFLWFLSLFMIGFFYIIKAPEVLKAVNPWYGIKFLLDECWRGYLTLGIIILCATGSEAMYADMGHLGARPIKVAWKFVFLAVTVNYFGQGAYLLLNPEARYLMFEMVKRACPWLYSIFLLLTILATVIASQAMISAMFSLFYQCISARFFPVLKVKYTSPELSSQIYIGTINWLLFVAVCYVMYHFKSSDKLAAAYGLAVTGVMVLTGIFLVIIFYLKKKKLHFLLAVFTSLVSTLFFLSTLHKMFEGGYIVLGIAGIPFFTILLYTQGQKRLYLKLRPYFWSVEEFLEKFNQVYFSFCKIPGKALFLVRDPKQIPPYVIETIFFHGIVYEENIFLSLIRKNEPYGIHVSLEEISPGIKILRIYHGYMEYLKIEEILKEQKIEERVIFYGIEDIQSNQIFWKLYGFIKQISPNFVKFLELPSSKLHGVLTRIEI